MNREQKESFVQNLKSIIADNSLVLVFHYRGMSMTDMTDLRVQSFNSGCNIKVTKNRLTKLALEGSDKAALSEFFDGPTAIAYSSDPVQLTKLLTNFAKNNSNLVILGGIMDNEVLDQAGVLNVASLPTLDEARANIVGILNASASKLVSILLARSEKMSSLPAENSETQPKE